MIKTEKPKSLEECMALDTYAESIWRWSEKIQSWGVVIFVVLIILGLLMASFGSATEVEKRGYYYSYTSTEYDFGLFFSVLVIWLLFALIEFLCYHVISLVLGALATMVQNSKVTASISLFRTCDKTGTLTKEDLSKTDEKIG